MYLRPWHIYEQPHFTSLKRVCRLLASESSSTSLTGSIVLALRHIVTACRSLSVSLPNRAVVLDFVPGVVQLEPLGRDHLAGYTVPILERELRFGCHISPELGWFGLHYFAVDAQLDIRVSELVV